MKARLDRRTFLKGALGAAVALPWLEAMADPSSPGRPLRYLQCFGGFSLSADTFEPSTNALMPDREGPRYRLPDAAMGLRDVREHVTLVSGLRIPADNGFGEVAPGGRHAEIGDSFHYHANPLFSGHAQVGDHQDMTVTGPSPDQIVADHHAGSTPFRSLVYRAQPAFYWYDNKVQMGVSSYRQVAGRVVPMAAERNAREAWLALTSVVMPSGAAERARRLAELRARRSVLDLVDRRTGRLRDLLGSADRQRLEQHFEAVRDIERLLADPLEEGGACTLPGDPGADAVFDPAGYSDEAARARVFHELIRMAFSCDLTRSAQLMYTTMKSNLLLSGEHYGIHKMQHEGQDADVQRVVAWHLDLWAELVALLHDTPEGDGTMLDHTAMVYLNEGGYGQHPGTGNGFTSHITDEMVLLVSGGAGGLVRGTHIRAPEGHNHPGHVLLTGMAAAGVEVEQFGDLSGEVPGLRG